MIKYFQNLISFNNINNNLRPSKFLIDLIKSYEGLGPRGKVKVGSSYRVYSYICPAGYPTIGYGRRIQFSEHKVLKDKGITLEQAEENLEEDVNRFAGSIKKLIGVQLQDYQFDALVSFSYNVGIANFKSSTLLKKVNKKDFLGASKEFGRWIYAKKKKLAGLVSRREAERRMFVNDPPRGKASYMLFLLTE